MRDPDFTDPKLRGIPIEMELIVVEEGAQAAFTSLSRNQH